MISLQQVEGSADGSVKLLWEVPDVGSIESLFIYKPNQDHNALCLSTQIGCAVGCQFCHVPLDERQTNLSADVIESQATGLIEFLDAEGRGDLTADLQVVYFGAGEPMHNLGNVLESKRRIAERHPDRLKDADLGRLRNFVVSTSGWAPGIRSLRANDPEFDLYVSLHATDEETRGKLIPKSHTFPIEEILAEAREYHRKTGRKVTANYLLIDGLNDGAEDVQWLRENLSPDVFRFSLAHLNNPRLESLEKSPEDRFELFQSRLESAGFETFIFESNATDVEGGCGQMRGYGQCGIASGDVPELTVGAD